MPGLDTRKTPRENLGKSPMGFPDSVPIKYPRGDPVSYPRKASTSDISTLKD